MKRRIVKIISICLMICMIGSLCGCSGDDGGSEKELPTSEGFTNDVLMRVGGVDVSYAEANLYLLSMREEVETLYGPDIWDYVFTSDGKTYAELMKEQLLEKIKYIKLVCYMADEFEIRLDADDILNVNDYTQQYLAGVTEETAKKYGITEELIRSLYTDNVLAKKIYETITLNADTTYSETEVLRAKFDYIFLSKYYTDDEGHQVPMTAEDMSALYRKAEGYLETAATKDDFYNYAKDVSDDTNVEKVVGRKDLPSKSREAAFALGKGQLSEIIEEADGLYIFYCVEPKDERATQEAEEAKIEELSREYFQTQYEKWETNIKIEINEALWGAM